MRKDKRVNPDAGANRGISGYPRGSFKMENKSNGSKPFNQLLPPK